MPRLHNSFQNRGTKRISTNRNKFFYSLFQLESSSDSRDLYLWRMDSAARTMHGAVHVHRSGWVGTSAVGCLVVQCVLSFLRVTDELISISNAEF